MGTTSNSPVLRDMPLRRLLLVNTASGTQLNGECLLLIIHVANAITIKPRIRDGSHACIVAFVVCIVRRHFN